MGAPVKAPPGSINRSSPLPLHYQLYEILREQIKRGVWQPGELIPAESELIQGYGVSRTTVRQVLDRLTNEGLIYRQQGRGTFVAHPTVEKALAHIVSFTDDMRQRGFRPGTRVLTAELVPAPADVAEKLHVAPGEELARLRRLRLADDEPMAIEDSLLVHRFCPGILERDLTGTSLRQLMEQQYRIRWSRAAQTVRAMEAPAAEAALLGVKRNAALLYIERVSFSQDDDAVEFLRVHYRGDRYVLFNELQA